MRIYFRCLPLFLVVASTCSSRPQATPRPELFVQTGHASTISTISFDPSGKWLVTGANDEWFSIWDTRTGRQIRSLGPAHPSSVFSAVAVSPDGELIAGGGPEGSVSIWSVRTGKVLHVLKQQEFAKSVAFCPQTGWLVSIYHGGLIRLWDVRAGTLIREFGKEPVRLESVSCGPNGKTVAVGGENGLVQLWDVSTGKNLGSLERQNKDIITVVAYSPEGSHIAAASILNDAVTVWDVQSHARVQTIHSLNGGFASAISFSPDGAMLATPRRVWDVQTGTSLEPIAVDYASAVAFDPSGHLLAVATKNRIELRPLHVPMRLVGHKGAALSVAWASQRYLLASAGSDGTVRLWNSTTGDLIRVVAEEPYAVQQVAFSTDARLLAWRSGGSVRALRLGDYKQIYDSQTECHPGSACSWGTFALSPDSKLLAYAGFVFNDGIHYDGIHLVDLNRERTIAILRNEEAVSSIAFTRDGRFLISGGVNGSIISWDLDGDRPVQTCKNGSPVASLAVSPDGAWIASGDSGGRIRIWESGSCRIFRDLIWQDPDSPKTSGGSVTSIAFSPDGKYLASSIQSVYRYTLIWNIVSGETQDEPNEELVLVNSLVFGADGRLAAACSDGAIKISPPSVVDQTSVSFVHNSIQRQKFAAFVGKSELISIGGESTQATTWDTAQGMPTKVFGPKESMAVGSLALSADGTRLAASGVGSDMANQVEALDLETGAPLWQASVPEYQSSLAFAPDGQYLAGGGVSMDSAGGTRTITGAIHVWDAANGHEVQKLSVPAHTLAFSPDARRIATAVRGEIRILDIQSGASIQTLSQKEIVESLLFTGDGKRLVVGGGNHIVIWDLVACVAGQELSQGGKRDTIKALVISPNDSMLASGSTDGTIKLWDISSGKELYTLVGHEHFVESVSFSANGRWLVSASLDGTLRVWDVQQGTLRATLISEGADWLVVTPEGEFDGSAGGWSRVLWRFGGDTFETAPVEAFFNEYYHPGLLADVLAGQTVAAQSRFAEKDIRRPTVNVYLTLANLPQAKPNATPTFAFDRMSVHLKVAQLPPDKDHSHASGARDLRLFRNGLLVKTWRGDLVLDQNGQFETTVDLPIVAGPNRFTAYAFNHDNVKSEDDTALVAGPEELGRPGTAYLFVIGLNRYANPDFDLRFAGADAQAFGDNVGREQTHLNEFSTVQVIPLFDQEATRENILLGLDRLSGKALGELPPGAPSSLSRLRRAGPTDVIFIYFAGHGVADGRHFYLIPHDLGYMGARNAISEADIDSLLHHSISDEELDRALEGIDAGRIVLVIDACNSGQALETEEKRRGPMNSQGLAQLAYEKGMYILTAAQSFQAAQEVAKLGHGLLTYALVDEGLNARQANQPTKDGTVDLRGWFDFAVRRVPVLQLEEMEKRQERGIRLSFVGGQEVLALEDRSLQRPRAFYRREPDLKPFLIAGPVQSSEH